MARICPILNQKVVYLSCQECEEDCRYAPHNRLPEHMFRVERRNPKPLVKPGKTVLIRQGKNTK